MIPLVFSVFKVDHKEVKKVNEFYHAKTKKSCCYVSIEKSSYQQFLSLVLTII
mgnify:CR=1 FL=1